MTRPRGRGSDGDRSVRDNGGQRRNEQRQSDAGATETSVRELRVGKRRTANEKTKKGEVTRGVRAVKTGDVARERGCDRDKSTRENGGGRENETRATEPRRGSRDAARKRPNVKTARDDRTRPRTHEDGGGRERDRRRARDGNGERDQDPRETEKAHEIHKTDRDARNRDGTRAPPASARARATETERFAGLAPTRRATEFIRSFVRSVVCLMVRQSAPSASPTRTRQSFARGRDIHMLCAEGEEGEAGRWRRLPLAARTRSPSST